MEAPDGGVTVGLWLEGLWGHGRGCVEGNGLSVGPPHLGAIGAFLPAERMFVDGSGRDRSGRGGAGERGWAGGSHRRKSRRERETALAQRAARVWGSAAPLCRVFPCVRPLGRMARGPDLCYYLPRPPEQSQRETSRDSSSRPGSDTHTAVDKIPCGPRTSCS